MGGFNCLTNGERWSRKMGRVSASVITSPFIYRSNCEQLFGITMEGGRIKIIGVKNENFIESM
jgi:hypothetical protein